MSEPAPKVVHLDPAKLRAGHAQYKERQRVEAIATAERALKIAREAEPPKSPSPNSPIFDIAQRLYVEASDEHWRTVCTAEFRRDVITSDEVVRTKLTPKTVSITLRYSGRLHTIERERGSSPCAKALEGVVTQIHAGDLKALGRGERS